MTTGNDSMKPHLDEVPASATKADIKRLELKLDQIANRLDTLLMEGGREAGAKANDMLQTIMRQASSHPGMTPQARQMLGDLLKPVMSGLEKGSDK